MSEELRQAAIRIAESAEAYLREHPGPEDFDYDAELAAHWNDQAMVARAWLSEHPDDDGELIDGEWLEATWFVPVPSLYNNRWRNSNDHLCVVEEKRPTRFAVHRLGAFLVHVKTRGELRRLLAALGVE